MTRNKVPLHAQFRDTRIQSRQQQATLHLTPTQAIDYYDVSASSKCVFHRQQTQPAVEGMRECTEENTLTSSKTASSSDDSHNPSMSSAAKPPSFAFVTVRNFTTSSKYTCRASLVR